ncbi:hypothetical protein GZH49_12980 [Nocardia terpenica]|uniref:CoA transferase n=1 Tax=Nocardia terpenica TaxID=455432 RepID=UPI002FE15505
MVEREPGTISPLAGLRVVEFGHYLAGPLTGVLLADQGADVLTVAPPTGSGLDPATTAILRRGKRVQSADLRDRDARAAVRDRVEQADVVIENFRPGVMDRLGFGYEQVAAINPAVIYLSLPGFSRHDDRAAMPGWEGVIAAACGFYTDLSLPGAVLDAPPTYTPLPLPSIYAGVHGAIAVAAAVFARLGHGAGDRIEVPLLDAAMSAAAGLVYRVRDQPDRYNMPPAPRRLLDLLSDIRLPRSLSRTPPGRWSARSTAWLGELTDRLSPPLFANYRCADGRYLFLCAMDNEKHVARLLDVTGLAATAADLGFVQGNCLDVPPSHHNINAYRGTSPRWMRLRRAMSRVFATRPAMEWERRLTEAGVPAAVQRSTTEWIEHTLATASGIVRHIDDRAEPGVTVDLSAADPGSSAFTPDSPRPHPRTPWLHGITVLDLSNVIAGPSCARTLAEFGADIIQIAPTAPRMGPRQTLHFGLEVNAGKRGIAVDLATDAGRRILHELAARSDVLAHNCLPRQAARLGFDPVTAHGINDRLITVAVTAFGGPATDIHDDLPGYDPTLQAATGIMTRYGGTHTPALHGLASCVDYVTGYSGAYAAILGLIARARGARHIHARTSLARLATWVQLPFLNAHGPQPSGLDARGTGPTDRIYRARDGWLFLSAGRPDAPAPGNLAAMIEKSTVTDAIDYARAHGWAAHRLVDARTMRCLAAPVGPPDPSAPPRSGQVRIAAHPSGLRYWVPVASWVRSDRTPRRELAPAPHPGQHTDEILTALGYSDTAIADLHRHSIVTDRWFDGDAYLPD